MSEHIIVNLRHCALSLDEKNSSELKRKMRHHALSIYGEDAITAVAYCALAAWCDCQHDEYQFWSELFNQMQAADLLH